MNWLKYGGAYLGMLIAVSIAYYLLSEFVSDLGGVALMAPVIAAVTPSSLFAKDHRRVPTPVERWQLLGLCYGIFVVVQVLQIAVAAAIWSSDIADMIDEIGGGLLAGLLVGVLLLEFGLMWVTFRFHPGMYLKSLAKSEARKAAKVR